MLFVGKGVQKALMLSQGKTKPNQTSPTANTKYFMAYGGVPACP